MHLGFDSYRYSHLISTILLQVANVIFHIKNDNFKLDQIQALNRTKRNSEFQYFDRIIRLEPNKAASYRMMLNS